MRVVLGEDGQGLGYVTCSTNDQVVLQLKIKRDATGTEVSTYGLVDGRQVIQSHDGAYETSYANFLRDKGIVPGDNSVSCALQHDDSLPVVRAEVLKDSSIFTTTYGTEPLSLMLKSAEGKRAPVGKPLTIAYRIQSRDTRAIAGVKVRLVTREDVTPTGTGETSFGVVAGAVDGSFVVTPRTPGTHQLTLMASSEVNNPILVFSFVAGGSPPIDTGLLLRWAGAALALVGSAVIVLGRRRRIRAGRH